MKAFVYMSQWLGKSVRCIYLRIWIWIDKDWSRCTWGSDIGFFVIKQKSFAYPTPSVPPWFSKFQVILSYQKRKVKCMFFINQYLFDVLFIQSYISVWNRLLKIILKVIINNLNLYKFKKNFKTRNFSFEMEFQRGISPVLSSYSFIVIWWPEAKSSS